MDGQQKYCFCIDSEYSVLVTHQESTGEAAHGHSCHCKRLIALALGRASCQALTRLHGHALRFEILEQLGLVELESVAALNIDALDKVQLLRLFAFQCVAF